MYVAVAGFRGVLRVLSCCLKMVPASFEKSNQIIKELMKLKGFDN